MTPDYFNTLSAIFEEFLSLPPKNEEEHWDYLIRKLSAAIECHAATFFEADDSRRLLTFKKSIGPVAADLTGVSFAYQGIAGWCAENRKPIIVNDLENDPRFTKKVDYGTGFKTKNVMAVPAVSGGKLLGVVEFINSIRGGFSDADLKMVSIASACITRAVYAGRLESTIKQLNLKGADTINNLSGGFIGVDLEGKVIFFNPKAREIFAAGDEYLDKNIISLFQLSPDIVGAIGDVLKQGKTVKRQEFKSVVNGKQKVIGYSSINIKGVDGNVIGAGIIFQDITDI